MLLMCVLAGGEGGGGSPYQVCGNEHLTYTTLQQCQHLAFFHNTARSRLAAQLRLQISFGAGCKCMLWLRGEGERGTVLKSTTKSETVRKSMLVGICYYCEVPVWFISIYNHSCKHSQYFYYDSFISAFVMFNRMEFVFKTQSTMMVIWGECCPVVLAKDEHAQLAWKQQNLHSHS